jgi:hypothetical protein
MRVVRRIATTCPAEGQLFGTSYREADRYSNEYTMDPDDLREICGAIRAAQLNADFVIVAIHSHDAQSAATTRTRRTARRTS